MSVIRKRPEPGSLYTQNYPSERADYEQRRREQARRHSRPSIADETSPHGRRRPSLVIDEDESDVVADPEGARRHGETPAA